MPNSLVHIETFTSQPIMVKDVQLHVRSQVLHLRLPFANGGLLWNRPVAVSVQIPDHPEQILPIQDVTRTTVLALTLLCVATLFFTMLFRRKAA